MAFDGTPAVEIDHRIGTWATLWAQEVFEETFTRHVAGLSNAEFTLDLCSKASGDLMVYINWWNDDGTHHRAWMQKGGLTNCTTVQEVALWSRDRAEDWARNYCPDAPNYRPDGEARPHAARIKPVQEAA